MATGTEAVKVPVSTICNSPPTFGLVPATYKVGPLSGPSRPTSSAVDAPITGAALPTALTLVTLAAVPPHSEPQLWMNALEASAHKTSETGSSKAAGPMATTDRLVEFTAFTVLRLYG